MSKAPRKKSGADPRYNRMEGRAPNADFDKREPAVETVPKERVLVMKPADRPEFADRRVAFAYEVKSLALAYTGMMKEAHDLGLDLVFNPYLHPELGPSVHVQVVVKLLT